MEHLFNVRTVCVANYIGLMMLVILFLENLWRLRRHNGENNAIMIMISTCIASCFLDPIAYYFDGIPGPFSITVAYISNVVLFMSYGIISTCWVYFMAIHLEGRFTRRHFIALGSIVAIVLFIVATNPILHIAFEIDDNGVYTRKIGYYINLLVNAIIVIDGLLLYARCRKKGGFMKSFPVAGYIAPISVAVIVQSNFYGVSVISPSIAVGIASILAGLKNENAYRDQMTGLYNRSYLDEYFDRIIRKHRVTGFMVQIANMEKINREKGFELGDLAIMKTAEFLNEAVGDLGVVARFSTDEFIVLLNTQADTIIKVCKDEILGNIDRFNQKDQRLSLEISLTYTKVPQNEGKLFQMLNDLKQLQ